MPEVAALTVPLVDGRQAILSIPRQTRDFPQCVKLEIQPAAGQTSGYFLADAWRYGSVRSRQSIAVEANLHPTDVEKILIELRNWVPAAERVLRPPVVAPSDEIPRPYGVLQRTIQQSASDPQVLRYGFGDPEDFGALLTNLRNLPNDTLLEWNKDAIERLVVLDLDFHRDGARPTDAELDEMGYNLSPAPWYWWRTQGGGLHAIYAQLNAPAYTAIELAAGAVAQLLTHPTVVRCRGTIDLVPRTRHPAALQKGKACGPIHTTMPDDTFECLASFSHAGATDNEITEVMEANGLVFGQRVDHTFCLIEPHHISTSPNPVVIMPTGIYCHSCAARHGNGWSSWGSVRQHHGLDVSAANEYEPIMEAVRHFAQFSHVNYLLDALAPHLPERCRLPLYSALLKKEHLRNGVKSDPRIAMALTPWSFVRGATGWLHEHTLRPVSPGMGKEDIAVLAAVCNIEPETGDVKPTMKALTIYTRDGGINGWHPIIPDMFTPFYAIHNRVHQNQGWDQGAICPAWAKREANTAVSYLPSDRRLPMAEAEKVITDHFPGVTMSYLKTLMVAVGCADSNRGMVPMIWVTGETGSAKTTTTRIVSEMFGESYHNLSDAKEDRLIQQFGEKLSKTRMILFDDCAKDPKIYNQLHTFILRVQREHSFHELYVGDTNIPVRSALIFTDKRTPRFMFDSTQFGRRVHLVRLEERVPDWEALGHKVEGWWRTSERLQHAAESFFSHIVDDFFPEGDEESFSQKAERLGVYRITENQRDTGEDDAHTEIVRNLAMALCTSKPMPDITEKRVGTGMREVFWGASNPLGTYCQQLVEMQGDVPLDYEHLLHGLESFDSKLRGMLGLVAPAKFQLRQYGKHLYIRLVESGTSVQSRKRVNEQLFTTWPPVDAPAAVPHPTLPQFPGLLPMTTATAPQPLDISRNDVAPDAGDGTLTVFLDFETQSACDLKKCGSNVYAEHPTTIVICAAIRFENRRIFWTMKPYDVRMPLGVEYEHGIEFLQAMVTAQPITLVPHNINFERAIWTHCLKLPQPAIWRDTMDITLMRGLPAGVDAAGQYLLGMGKDLDGHKLMMKTCKPNKKGVMPEVTTSVVQRYIDYNFRDTDIGVGIADKFGLQIHPAWEQEVNRLHHEINHYGIYLDRQFAETLRNFDEFFKAQAGIAVERASRGAIKRSDLKRNDFVRNWLADEGLVLDNMRADQIERILQAYEDGEDEAVDIPPHVIAVLQNRMVVTRAALSKVDTALRCAAADGRMKAQLRYWGAHTGRWSGYQIQPQNMKRPDEDFDLKGAIEAIERNDRETFERLCDGKPPYELLGSLVRGIIAPAPGCVLVVGDYSQVEARGLLWLCEDWENMQEHLNYDAGTGPDIYCLAAQALYGRKITKKENPLERQTGKISELACGYQGGVGAINRFAYTLNVDLEAAGITDKQIVEGWRAKHPKAVALWRGYNETAIRAMEHPGRTYDYGRCDFRFLNGNMEIILPSQRILTYHNARIRGSTRAGWEENKVIAYDLATRGKAVTHETYGGKLTENITQALCRDFLADALLRIAAEGYPIPLHVHDEVVAEPLIAQGEECARVMKQIMCTPPEWAPRMPLVAKPDIVLRYGK